MMIVMVFRWLTILRTMGLGREIVPIGPGLLHYLCTPRGYGRSNELCPRGNVVQCYLRCPAPIPFDFGPGRMSAHVVRLWALDAFLLLQWLHSLTELSLRRCLRFAFLLCSPCQG